MNNRIFTLMKKVKDYLYSLDSSIKFMISFILITRSFFYLLLTSYTLSGDSAEYININSLEIFKGNLNERRVPGYAALIDFIQFITSLFTNSEDLYLKIIVLLQIILSYIAIIFFFKILKLVINRRIIVVIGTILYACSPSVIGWDKVILTESISISGTVIYIYLMFNYIRKPSVKIGGIINLISIILTFIRPTFVLFIIINAAFWILRLILYKSERVKTLFSIMGVTLCSLVILIYASTFKHQFGNFSLSNTLLQQNCITIAQQSLYGQNINEASIPIVVDIINNNNIEHEKGCIEAAAYILTNYSNQELQAFVDDCKKSNSLNWFKYYLRTTFLLANVEFPNNTWYGTNIYTANTIYQEKEIPIYSINNNVNARQLINIYRSLNPKICFVHVYLGILFNLGAFIYSAKRKKFAWTELGLFSFSAGIVMLTIVGTCGEWVRTAICVIPFFYITIAMLLDKIIQHIRRNTLRVN